MVPFGSWVPFVPSVPENYPPETVIKVCCVLTETCKYGIIFST